MFVEVTGNLVQGTECKDGRFLINPSHIAVLGANGTKANFYMDNGITIYSDATLADILRKLEQLEQLRD